MNFNHHSVYTQPPHDPFNSSTESRICHAFLESDLVLVNCFDEQDLVEMPFWGVQGEFRRSLTSLAQISGNSLRALRYDVRIPTTVQQQSTPPTGTPVTGNPADTPDMGCHSSASRTSCLLWLNEFWCPQNIGVPERLHCLCSRLWKIIKWWFKLLSFGVKYHKTVKREAVTNSIFEKILVSFYTYKTQLRVGNYETRNWFHIFRREKAGSKEPSWISSLPCIFLFSL